MYRLLIVNFLLVKGNTRLISPASSSYLSTKLPRSQRVDRKLFDNEKPDSELRKRNREGDPPFFQKHNKHSPF
jgi:hypothetical protein